MTKVEERIDLSDRYDTVPPLRVENFNAGGNASK